jgi:hypothetical protein
MRKIKYDLNLDYKNKRKINELGQFLNGKTKGKEKWLVLNENNKLNAKQKNKLCY